MDWRKISALKIIMGGRLLFLPTHGPATFSALVIGPRKLLLSPT
jgi:hypothetical protein